MQEIQHALSEPFGPDQVEWKPQAVKENHALAVAYIDARTVMDRLDAVLGVGGWQTSYREMASGVVCTLRVKVDGEWVSHEDVGSFSEQPDQGDKLKAAFSDALKRVAVHVGIGRYLYALPKQWCDFDPKRRQFVKAPTLPAWALPHATNGSKPAGLPTSGKELLARLVKHEQKLVGEGRCLPGDLVRHVLEAGQRAGYPAAPDEAPVQFHDDSLTTPRLGRGKSLAAGRKKVYTNCEYTFPTGPK
jgi:hypothetical protein